MDLKKTKYWIQAARIRTLPLALSGIFMSSIMVFKEDKFNIYVFVLASLTAVLLQILANYANDYGDYTKGTDSVDRLGPERVVSSGKISANEMVKAIYVLIGLSLIFGLILIWTAIPNKDLLNKLLFILIGIFAIIAAIKYTVGRNPYGYYGFGDFFVFIFFGIVSVCGTYYLYMHDLSAMIFFPASSIGFFSVGVINVNNMRDYKNDIKSQKKTLSVILGDKNSRIYHLILISLGFVSSLIYTIFNFRNLLQFLFLLVLPLFIAHIIRIFKSEDVKNYNNELKTLSLNTFFFSVLFGISQIL